MSRWYSVGTAPISERGGAGLLAVYEGSLAAALASVFPEHTWEGFRFERVSSGYWMDPTKHREFFEWIGKNKLGITKMDDWYKVSKQGLIDAGGMNNSRFQIQLFQCDEFF
jgi:hypothetical protein